MVADARYESGVRPEIDFAQAGAPLALPKNGTWLHIALVTPLGGIDATGQWLSLTMVNEQPYVVRLDGTSWKQVVKSKGEEVRAFGFRPLPSSP